MSIAEVLLFIATNSRSCSACMEFIERHGLPVKVVRLDSEEARNIAANGTYFQITAVPTMVVIYDDGNTQLFTGAPKITQWLTMLIKRQEPEKERGVTSYTPAGGNMYGPRPNPPRPRYIPEPEDQQPQGHQPQGHQPQGHYQDHQRRPPTSYVVEEDEPEEEPPKPKPKKKTKPAPEPVKKAPKKKKKPPVQFEEEPEEVEVEYIEEPPKPSSRAGAKVNSNPKAKKNPSRMTGVIDKAKQMEQDRKNSLGYREEDLPHY